MANFRAIMAVSEAIVNLLRSSYMPEDFNNELEFKVFTSKDFSTNSISNGVSLFPYRIYTNGSHRIPAGRVGSDGRPLKHKLPVELHCLVTVWGKEASLQNSLAGWIMRTLEDNAILPANLLNSVVADVFHADETVEISLAELTTEDLFRIWDVLGMNIYQLSIPYVVRIIEIDSMQSMPSGEGLVQQRRVKLTELEP
ncbi:MAG TPA: DUF4255 domain-containing protein [Gammaproteobacteria bacterium]|nr:DUF4255 domain-containing protein [Gammaproteobacteria bacterium]